MEHRDSGQPPSQQSTGSFFPVENLVSQLDQMAMDSQEEYTMSLENHSASFKQQSRRDAFQETMEIFEEMACDEVVDLLEHSSGPHCRTDGDVSQMNQRDRTKLLVVTYPKQPSISWSESYKAQFESIFQNYDPEVIFHYMPKTCRVRLAFTKGELAELALSKLGEFSLDDITFRCFPLDPIRSKPLSLLSNSNHLQIPKAKRMFLISPPPSPPEGWAPRAESPPVIDVQLISALSNLLPGQVHEIHAATDTQPGIYVEVCEDSHKGDCQYSTRIPRTTNPAVILMDDNH